MTSSRFRIRGLGRALVGQRAVSGPCSGQMDGLTKAARYFASTLSFQRKHHKPIEVLDGPNHEQKIDDFKTRYLAPGIPVVIRGLVKHWPAVSHPIRRWSNFERLRQDHGHHVVPVELGADYMHAEKSDLDFGSFLDYLELSSAANGPQQLLEEGGDGIPRLYLAQHPLLDQIPALQDDLDISSLASLIPLSKLYMKNAWFAPQGAVSPLHHDPYANLYIQVHGDKVWRLWSPEHSESMHISKDPLQRNTSTVDPRGKNVVSRFPGFPLDEQLVCTVRPGDAIFVPPKWWHHVEASSVSLSVSLWWV